VAGPPATGAVVPSPLRSPIFRAVWIASIVSNVGTWMQMVASPWLMSSLTASAVLVGLVQTAMSAPGFVLALPAGALADVLDRRKLILVTQGAQFLAAACLGVLAITDAVTPALLLCATFLLGVGSALARPVLWAIVPDLVPRTQLARAISLNSVSMTLAQAIGPPLAGLTVAWVGAGGAFVLNSVSFLGTVVAVRRWTPAPRSTKLPPERIVAAARTGVRFTRNSRPFQIVLVRVASHFIFFSILPALLVVVSRGQLDQGAGGFGALFGAFGAGGAAGAFLFPRLRKRLSVDGLIAIMGVVFGASLVALAESRALGVALGVLVVTGFASMTVISLLQFSVQSVLPGWVRGRGLAIYLLTSQSMMGLGAALWGTVATAASIETALIVAAIGMAIAHVVAPLAGLRLATAEDIDLEPTSWSEPALTLEPEPSAGPVMIEIEYRIAEEDVPAFLAGMHEVGRLRRRDGAMQWSVYRDLSEPERMVESFLVGSWDEHERAHERQIQSDRTAIERVLALQRGDAPRVSHLLAQGVAKP
jgi:predicted MFS family arabinose efflux permease